MFETGKKNCWEVKQCGREYGGRNTHDCGVCPACSYEKLDGVHGGKNAGRSCWVVAGSMCGGEIQGTYAQKHRNCHTCDFYMKVKSEEHADFQFSVVLLARVQAD